MKYPHALIEFDSETDSKGLGALISLPLLDASIIGACAVSLSTAYALGDVFAVRQSLHRKPAEAKGFYAVYFGLTMLAAGLVLTPGVPLGLLTNAVQSLAGILLPSATVFLLLLCNDKAVLGPWVSGRWTNLFTGVVVAGLVMLSIILTASVLFPQMGEREILGILLGGTVLALTASLFVKLYEKRRLPTPLPSTPPSVADKTGWTMPPLAELPTLKLTLLNRVWMLVLRRYLLVAAGLVLVRIVTLVAAGH